METEQLCEEEISNLEVINLYFSRETSRDLVERLEDLEIGKGYQVIGHVNTIRLREMASKVNTNLSNKNLNTEQRYKQIIDEQNLTYTIIRKE